jgi:microcystin-dependent protein
MPYNGSGGFSLAQSAFLPNTVISSSEMNSDLSDIATNGLTNAVTKDGQTTITAGFKGASGSVGLPMYAFSSDPDTGMYRIGANNVGISANGAKVLDIATTGLTVTGILSADSIEQGGAVLLPAGIVIPYAGSAAPTGWLLCNGASLLRADQPALFTAIGTTYGAADGTHFSLPDCTGRLIAGKEASATRLTTAGCGIDGATLGAAGGFQNIALITAELASHTHTGTTGTESATHTHAQESDTMLNGPPVANFAGGGNQFGTGGTTGTESATHTHSFTSNPTGSGTAHNNVQPTIVLNYIIKT